MESGLLALAALGYLAASVCYGAAVLLRHERLAVGARAAAMLAVACQTVAIGIHCASTHHSPFTTPASALTASAWAIALVYVVVDLTLRPQPIALGALAQPIAFLCLFAGVVLHRATHGGRETPGRITAIDTGLVSLHVVAILFAFGLLALAFGCAVLYLTQHSMLKKKRSGGLFGKLPPLTSIDRMAFSFVAFAFPLLTIGFVSGVIRAANGVFPGGWAGDPKILLSFATWTVYATYLGLHVLAHWRGPRANYLLIGGMVVAVATYFVTSNVHRFG